jgi:hypothetical protein
MLFFMRAMQALVGAYGDKDGRAIWYWLPVRVIVGVLEANALGLLGGTGQGPIRKYLETHRDTIISGFVLWVILYLLLEMRFG